jgi:hypothetical protein
MSNLAHHTTENPRGEAPFSAGFNLGELTAAYDTLSDAQLRFLFCALLVCHTQGICTPYSTGETAESIIRYIREGKW